MHLPSRDARCGLRLRLRAHARTHAIKRTLISPEDRIFREKVREISARRGLINRLTVKSRTYRIRISSFLSYIRAYPTAHRITLLKRRKMHFTSYIEHVENHFRDIHSKRAEIHPARRAYTSRPFANPRE